MGMSASQARFLSLTARKNNVEFEGQQINQQRTTLSNESASYYSQLCNMKVPTPPSIDDYTKVTYTFNDGAMTNTLISLLPDKTSSVNNRYVVNYVEQWQDDYAIVPAASSLVEVNDPVNPTSFSIGGQKLRKIGDSVNDVSVTYPAGTTRTYHIGQDGNYYFDNNSKGSGAITHTDGKTYAQVPTGGYAAGDSYAGAATNGDFVKIVDIGGVLYYPVTPTGSAGQYKIYNLVTDTGLQGAIAAEVANQAAASLASDPYASTLNKEQLNAMLKNEEYLLKMAQEKTGDNGDFYIRYVLNSTTGNYEPYLYAESELKQSQKYNNKLLGSIPCFSLGSTTQTREILHKPAVVEKDSSGRYVAITIELGTDDTGAPITRTYPLTTTTTTDEEAYNDAMNQYNYAQHEYDHKIQEINSKLEIVQQQDKQLELKLKQLDTEENAISTEMDAVKKVISKNVESSFKTFNA